MREHCPVCSGNLAVPSSFCAYPFLHRDIYGRWGLGYVLNDMMAGKYPDWSYYVGEDGGRYMQIQVPAELEPPRTERQRRLLEDLDRYIAGL